MLGVGDKRVNDSNKIAALKEVCSRRKEITRLVEGQVCECHEEVHSREGVGSGKGL